MGSPQSRIAFRVDASRRIGSGHVMRCLTLADALRAHGAESVFIHRELPGHMAAVIRERGHAVQALPAPDTDPGTLGETDYTGWLGVSGECDARETAECLEGAYPDWLVVDHYALDVEWESRVRPSTQRIAVLDDLANRDHDCDLLIDQNYFPAPSARYAGRVPEGGQCLLGPRYALLRPEYLRARRSTGPRQGAPHRILVFYGGSDTENETGRALRVLSRPGFEGLAVDVVVGASNPRAEELQRQAAARPNTSLHAPREHLVDLQSQADLALGAGGITTWERCVLGLPTIVTAVAENQVPTSQALATDGIIGYLGHWREISDDRLAAALNNALSAPEELHAQAARAWRVTDGLGAWRIAEVICPTPRDQLMLRPAEAMDRELYFDWANDPVTRRLAHHPEPISWETHVSWFDSRLADPRSGMWVLQTPQGLPVGQARVERQGGEAILSYGIEPGLRGRGWGSRLLELAIQAWADDGGSFPLIGEVRPENEASLRAFRRAGFERVDEGRYGSQRFRLSRPG